jgi:hypothetical protein
VLGNPKGVCAERSLICGAGSDRIGHIVILITAFSLPECQSMTTGNEEGLVGWKN